jgi:hypothetical protein
MNGGTLSGGVVIALAATLWLAYLLPTWLRRRDYLNAERNAVRLQQTLRILAETAETPEEVRVEATAREVARQQKILKKVRAKADAAARAHLASEERAAARLAAKANAPGDDVVASSTSSAAQKPPRTTHTAPAEAEPRSSRARKASATAPSVMPSAVSPSAAAPSRAERERTFAHAVRRTRLATTGALLASLVGIGFGAYSLIAVASWGLLAASVALLMCAVAVLRRLSQQVAAHRTARESRLNVVRQDPELYDHALHVELEAPREDLEQRDTSWAPQPLPKPMYQSPGSRAATAMASLDAAVALRRAAARAELEERAARLAAADVPSIAPREPQVAQPAAVTVAEGGIGVQASEARAEGQQTAHASRYARMGVLDDVQAEHIDLDEALRRRRVAG